MSPLHTEPGWEVDVDIHGGRYMGLIGGGGGGGGGGESGVYQRVFLVSDGDRVFRGGILAGGG